MFFDIPEYTEGLIVTESYTEEYRTNTSKMVSSTDENLNKTVVLNKKLGQTLPPGNYTLVGWDMDATGRKLIDEICQIAGYTPESSYSQYVMPYKDLNRAATKRHGIKIISISKFRMLKDIKTNKILKTKSEVSALNEFIAWLETVKGDTLDGIVLVYHEHRKVLPTMLLESLKKWNLLDRFKQTVKGFVNGYNIAKDKSSNGKLSMRTLKTALLNKEDELTTAVNRAQLALEITQKLITASEESSLERNEIGDGFRKKKLLESVRPYVQTVEEEEIEHEELKAVLKRENTLKPIFAALLCTTRRERQQASPLRRLLAEAEIEYLHLQEAWNNGKKDGLEQLLKEKVQAATPKDVQELLRILECHFDEEKAQQLKLEQEKLQAKKKNYDSGNNNVDSGNDSADTTLIHSPVKVKAPPTENIKEEGLIVQ